MLMQIAPTEGPPLSKPDVYLGVLCARKSSRRRPYHEQTTFFRRLIAEARAIRVEVFVFSPGDVNWRSRRVRGWTYIKGKWHRRLYRFPHAVFDRVSPKGKADLAGVPATRRRFGRAGVPLFNTPLAGKWGMHKVWRRHEVLKELLPETRVLNNSSLAQMLSAFGEVYIKPIHGGQGHGVAWVKRVKGGYRYRVHGGRGARLGKVKTIAAVRARCGGRRACIVQQAIDVLRCDGRSFDVRALVQRHLDGEWHVTGMVARLGAKRSKVTNIHAGGRARPLRDVLIETGATEEQVDHVIRHIERMALETAAVVSRSTKLVGELGIDFAVDKTYRAWLLEANSRTGRISLHRAGDTEAGRQADRSPAEFALFLAKERRAI